ncbi:MAG: BTAD domain-containing putative transcriptional regulator [Propionicimonas sp.]
MFQIAVLGRLEVRRDGRLVPVPGGKTSELLVRLALEAGLFVRADRLIDDVWAAGALNTRRNTLESKIAILRRALGDPRVIASGDRGYSLAVEPSDVDALAALGRVATASRLLEDGDDRRAADLCTSTLKLFRGDLLLAAGDGDWVNPHRARLQEARMTLVEIQLTARLRLGDVGDVIGELEAAVVTYPFREDLWELLITALYRAGRQADALATYKRVKDQLAKELGLDPGPKLQRLQQLILSHDESLWVAHRSAKEFEPDTRSGNLPSMAVELVGRETEVAALRDLLARERLVEIVGLGGVGKTAVAVATGRRLSSSSDVGAGGVWLARLETAVTTDDVMDTLIAAIGVPGGPEALFERLKGTVALVILDNCEHVVDAVAALASRLLDAAPGLRVLCTSQVPLDVDGEVVLELEPLTLPDAVELFNRRASAQRLAHTAGESHDAVLDLCRSLDGLPLAIELAAARTKTLSIEEITRRLDDRFRVLSDPSSRRPERRRSLKSTIRWSYDLLFPDDQRGLWALSTFGGGAPLPAVEFVLEALEVPAAAAIDVVGRLASRSLVIVDDVTAPMMVATGSNRAQLDSVRYRLLDSIRAFALDAMADAGLSTRALAAHATWFAHAAESSTAGVRSSDQAEHLSFARAERANIDAALGWSASHDPLLALRIVNGFGWAWVVLGDSRGAQRILAALEAAGDAGKVPDRASALLLAAWIEASTGDLELAHGHIAAATELADTIKDVDLQARCSYYLAYVVSHQGEFQQAMELTDRSAALYDGLDRPWDQAANWLFAARAAISAGDQQRSIDALDHVQHWLRTVEDPWLHVRYEAMLGELARIQHRFDDAVLHIGRAAQTSRRLGFQQTEAYQVAILGRAQCQAGDYDAGSATLELAIEKAELTGDLRLAALARVHWGRVLRATGQLTRARTALEAAIAWHRGAGGGEQAVLGECLLAALDAADQVPGAGERLTSILDDARHNDDADAEVFALDALARLAAVAGDITTARDLCAVADRRMAVAAHFITDLDRTDAHWVTSIT